MTGSVGYHAGQAAEGIVAAHYVARGCDVQANRWRSKGGEIDLVLNDGGTIVFVEVKKSKDFASAALRVSERQMQRIYASAGAYLANSPMGQDSESRFDIALVDCFGAVEILENAYMQ